MMPGCRRTIQTDETGRFSADGLPQGGYSVEVSANGFAPGGIAGQQLTDGATKEVSISMNVAPLNQAVTVQAVASVAAQLAPAGNTLDATSAKTEISGEFIRNFTSPVSDFAELVNLAPGTFSLNPNGVGLGQGKTYFRGFQDGQYTITFDGIPFEDTTSPTHHSWANFRRSGLAEWISTAARDKLRISAPPISVARSTCCRPTCHRAPTSG